MKNLGLVVRPDTADAIELALQIVTWAAERKVDVYLDERSGYNEELQHRCTLCSPQELVRKCDPIVTLGGDGTLIGIARHVDTPAPLMIGVNFGTLGFLTEVTPDEVFTVLDLAEKDQAPVGERSMIRAEVWRGTECLFSSQAVNEALVQKGSRDRLLDLDLRVRGEEVMRLRADGMIVATPTGSTAYSLAAGGSIAYPSLSIVLVTPICAHSLTSRPLILPLDFQIEISLPDYEGDVFLSVDGQDSCELQSGDSVRIMRSEHILRFVMSQSKSYFTILRNKLNWGIANKSE